MIRKRFDIDLTVSELVWPLKQIGKIISPKVTISRKLWTVNCSTLSKTSTYEEDIDNGKKSKLLPRPDTVKNLHLNLFCAHLKHSD